MNLGTSDNPFYKIIKKVLLKQLYKFLNLTKPQITSPLQ